MSSYVYYSSTVQRQGRRARVRSKSIEPELLGKVQALLEVTGVG
jgi:hypothetical protein